MKLDKMISDSLKVLDNQTVRLVLVAAVVLYVANVLPRYSVIVNTLCSHPVVRVLALLGVMCVSCKDVPLGLLLAIAYVVSVQGKCMEHLEHQVAGTNELRGVVDVDGRDTTGDEGEEEDVREGMTGNTGHPAGANVFGNCSADCASGGLPSNLSNVCAGYGALQNEMNAQGLNCPVVGYTGHEVEGASL